MIGKASRAKFVMAAILIFPIGLPGCGTTPAVAPAPGAPKVVGWAPPTGGGLYVDYASPSSMPTGKILMARDAAYDALRPAGVNPTYVAYTSGLGTLSPGTNVVLDYLWQPTGSAIHHRVGGQDFIFTSANNDYIATP